MIRTYIYGIPHGFNFFENDVEYLDYFKAFYISSRKGRRMVVNRRENGETVYSYLQYGLREVERQPLHAFFGMSIVFDDFEYCADFKTLLNWFDTIYDKFVKEHGIINLDTDGNYRYQVHRFEEKAEDVHWLKNNLPNIITKSDQISLQKYDNSFADGSTGQVAGYNQTVNNEQLLNTLKKYRWVSINSEITEKSIPDTSDNVIVVQPEIELNFNELKDKLNELNKETLLIAVDGTKGSANVMLRISEEISRNIKSIQDYLLSQPDTQEAIKFAEIVKAYDTLLEQVKLLAIKYEFLEPTPNTKYCYSCKLNKPISEFSSPEATKCLVCESNNNHSDVKPESNSNKQCQSCKQLKPLFEFSSPDAIVCRKCEQRKPFDWNKLLLPIVIGIVLVGVIIASFIFLPKSCTHNDTEKQKDISEVPLFKTGDEDEIEDDVINVYELSNLLSNRDYSGVLDYISSKNDNHSYDQLIRDSIQYHLWQIIEDPTIHADVELQKFWIEHQDLLNHIEFTDVDKEYWVQLENNYKTIRLYLSKQTLTKTEYDNAMRIVSKYNQIPKEWSKSLTDKWNSQNNQNKDNLTYTITYIDVNGQQVTKNIEKRIQVTAKKGTNYIITAPKGKTILENKKDTLTEIANQKKVIHCDNSSDVTIDIKDTNNGFKPL